MTEQEKVQLRGFIEYYVSAFQELNKLEEELSALHQRKEMLSEKIKSTKEKEVHLMNSIREKYGEEATDAKYLMKMLGIKFNDLVETK